MLRSEEQVAQAVIADRRYRGQQVKIGRVVYEFWARAEEGAVWLVDRHGNFKHAAAIPGGGLVPVQARWPHRTRVADFVPWKPRWPVRENPGLDEHTWALNAIAAQKQENRA